MPPQESQSSPSFLRAAKAYWPWVVAGLGLLAIAAYWAVGAFARPPQTSITYETKQLFATDEGGGISYPVLTGGAPKPILDKINAQIYTALVVSSCWGDPNDINAVQTLQDDYIEQLGAYGGIKQGADISSSSAPSSAAVKSWSYDTAREHLIADFGWSENVWPRIDMASSTAFFSFDFTDESYCGGAHLNNDSYGFTFDLKTGNEVTKDDLFTNYAGDKSAIAAIIYQYAGEASPPQGDGTCDYVQDAKNGDLNPDDIEYALTPQGIKLLSFGYPHAVDACNPAGAVTVPYSLLAQYLKPQLRSLKGMIIASSTPFNTNDFLIASSTAINPAFAGSWQWHSDTLSVELDLQVLESDLAVIYVAVYKADGTKIDGCVTTPDHPECGYSLGEQSSNGPLPIYVEQIGQGTVTYDPESDTLRWHITKPPLGDYYLPDDATLVRIVQ